MSGGWIGAALGAGGMNDAMAQVVAGRVASEYQKNVGGWFPSMFMALQQLFNVGHSFVLRKLLLLLCPFLKRGNQGEPSQPWTDGGSCGASSNMDGSLKVNIEEPDLYIPLMSFVTYILAFGVQRIVLSDFSPEVLSSTASFAMILMLLEVGVAKTGFYLAGSSVPMLDMLANCGYKFVPVVLMVLIRIITRGSKIYYVFFAYLAACAAFSLRRFMLLFQPSQLRQQFNAAPSRLHGHIILGLAIAQVPLCWLLTPSYTPKVPSTTA